PLHRVSQSLVDHFEGYASRLVRLLLERGVDVNARDEEQATPLHLAFYYGDDDNVAKVLLDHGALVNAKDIRGQTPLHRVVLGNHDYHSFTTEYAAGSWDRKGYPKRAVRLARRLLERGADVNAQNEDHETPLHLASRLRLLDMAQILLKHGANVNVKNFEGKSPLQLASGRKRKAMRRLLLEYSANQ
ncbi:ankyrin repeat-containing domain protein, partial [Lactarius pseudohatsudake]